MTKQMTLEQAITAIRKKFTSGNSVPVERATIAATEWAAIDAHLNTARGEAVAWQYREVTEDGHSPVWDEASRMHFEILRNDRRYEVRELYTHPASPDVVRDAERYRWLRDEGDSTWNPLVKRKTSWTTKEVDAAIDAAMAAREGGK